MNKESWKTLVDRLKSRYAILIAVIAVGLLVNIYVFVALVLPPWATDRSLQRDLSNVVKQREAIQARPNPLLVSDEQLLALALQLPTKPEFARLLLSLKDMEKKAGVTLEAVNFGDVNGGKDDSLSNMLASGAIPTNSPAPAEQTTAATAPASGQQNPIVEDKLTVRFTGKYAGMLQFIESLKQSERHVEIKDWQLNTAASTNSATGVNALTAVPTPTPTPSGTDAAPRLEVTLTLAVFSAPSFEGKLKELPPVPLKPVEKRSDPTASNDEFDKLLESLGQTEQGGQP